MAEQKKIKVTLVRSIHGRKPNHLECVRGLGLRRINDTAEVIDTPANRGMIDKVSYLLQIEEQ